MGPSKRKQTTGENLTMDDLTKLMNDVEIKEGKGGNNSGGKGGEGHSAPKNICGDDAILYRPVERRAVFAKRKKDFTLMKKLGRGPEREDARMETKECLASIVLRPQTQKCVSDLIT